MSLSVGARLGPYEVVEFLGRGGMGEVYRARDTRLGRDVALKILPLQLADDGERRARFEREARAISGLSHPHISTLHDIGEHEGTPYLVMEYLAGETLAARLRRGALPLAQALQIGRELADGLSAAHRRGIVHRDLKPANVMLTKDGAKLLDFGVAKVAEVGEDADQQVTTMEALTGAGTVLGTRPYMAPEQVEGKPLDARTDIWALGTILYEMLAGQRAFAGDTTGTLMVAILGREPEPLSSLRPDIPPALDRLIRRCLAKDPEARWDTAHDVGGELEWIAQAASGSGPMPLLPGASPVGHWRERRPRATLAVASALAGVVALWWLIASNEGRGGAEGNTATRSAPAAGLLTKPKLLTSGAAWKAAPAISPDGNLVAYVSDESGRPDIWVTGVGGTTPLRLTNDDAVEGNPCWYPDGRTLAFATNRGGRQGVWKIPTLGGDPTLLVADATDPAIDPAGTRVAFIVAATGRVAVAPLTDPQRNTVLTDDEDGLWQHRAPAWSPDGRTIAYAAQRGLWTVPAAGGDAMPLTTDGEADEEPAWSADGRHVYFSSARDGTQAIWRVAAGGGLPERVTLGSGPESHPSLSRSGREMVFTTFVAQSNVVIRDLTTGREVSVPGGRQDIQPSFSRDGRSLVFASDRAGGPRLWLQPLADGALNGPLRMLTDFHGTSPRFSPDGRWVSFYRVERQQPRSVWILPAFGGAPTRVLESPEQQWHPAWSPDGDEVVFVSEQRAAGRLLAVGVAEGRSARVPRVLTPEPGNYMAPDWSPDGKTVSYIATVDSGDSDVWTTRADGSGQRRQLTHAGTVVRAKWHPRGHELLVTTLQGQNVGVCRVSREGGALRDLTPPLHLGGNPSLIDFDLSADGRWFTYARDTPRGDVWMVEVQDQ
jgi:Tol biopolymer transport system component